MVASIQGDNGLTGTADRVAGIVDDIVNGRPYRPHSTNPPRDFERAYADPDAVSARLISSGKRGPVAGYKIAVNSRAQMDFFRISEPASGRVFSDQMSQPPAKRRVSDYSVFAFEPEIAAVLRSPIAVSGTAVEREQALAAIDRFVPALELLDLRHAKLQEVHLPDVIAQNITNAGAVLGGNGTDPSTMETAAIVTTVNVSGQPLAEVVGAAPQDPVEAVCWLANHLALRGIELAAGQFVLCGTHIPMQPVEGLAEIVVDMSGLGRVTLSLAKEGG